MNLCTILVSKLSFLTLLALSSSVTSIDGAAQNPGAETERVAPEPVRVLCVGDSRGGGDQARLIAGLRAGFAEVARRQKETDWLRPFVLRVAEDRGDAKQAVTMLEEAIEDGRVDLVVGGGTTTQSPAFRSRLRQARVLQFAPHGDWTKAQLTDAIALGAPTDLLVERLLAELVRDGRKRVALLTTTERSGLRAIVSKVLESHELRVATHVSHERGDRDLSSQAEAILAALPDAVLLLGEPAANLRLVRRIKARDKARDIRFATTASSDESALVHELGDDAAGLYVASGLPWPWADWLPIAVDWNELCKKRKLRPETARSFRAFEGYVIARFLERVVAEEIGGSELSSALPRALNRRREGWDLDGLRLDWSKGRRFGSSRVYLSMMVGGSLQVVPDPSSAPPNSPGKD